MNGNSVRELGVSQALHEKLCTSRVGMRWERIVRSHASEVEALMAIHPDVREHVHAALCALDEHRGVLAEPTISTVTRAIDDLQRLGSIELQLAMTGFREELAMARGRSLEDVLEG